MSKKIVLPIFALIPLLLLLMLASVGAMPPTQAPGCEEDYTVQAGDWLSKIAEKYYGDVLAYPLIADATNLAAQTDATYSPITNPGVIEVGQVLCLPSAEEGSEYVALHNDLTAGSVVGSEVMHLILGNRSHQEITATITLSGGEFGQGQTFDIAPSSEQKFDLPGGRYNIAWETPYGTISRDFDATTQVATIAWLVPEDGLVVAENQWAGGLAGASRSETELGWLHPPSAQHTETPYSVSGDDGLIVAGNHSFENLYASLNVSGGRFGGEGLDVVVGPGQEILLLAEPTIYNLVWKAQDGIALEPFTKTTGAAVSAGDVTVSWVSPEEQTVYIQWPGRPGEALQ